MFGYFNLEILDGKYLLRFQFFIHEPIQMSLGRISERPEVQEVVLMDI